jgi:hypothetical protein
MSHVVEVHGERGNALSIRRIVLSGHKKRPGDARSLEMRDALGRCLVCLEAVQAEDRATALGLRTRLERNLARVATLGTRSGVHLPLGEALLLALVAAILATLWGGKAALLVKRLLTLGERELRAAVSTGKLLISHKKEKKRK